MTYSIKCEKEAAAGRQWSPCGDDVVVLPDSVGLDSTSVSITGLDPQHNYRLSVQALNDVSILQGTPTTSTATIAIHRCMYHNKVLSTQWFQEKKEMRIFFF